MVGSGYRRPPLLVRRHDGQTAQLTPLLYRVLEAIDGRRDHAELAEVVSDRVSRLLEADDIRFLIEAKLRPLGLLRGPDGAEPSVVRTSPLLGLRFRFVVTNPRVTGRLSTPFARLFHPGVAVPVVLAFFLVSWWALFHEGLGTAMTEAIYQPRLILVLIALTIASAAFHELGHAAACHREGGTPGAMGAALYLVWPVFYTDVTDSYRLGRAGRLRVDLGGLYFNGIFTLCIVGVWGLVKVDGLLVMVPIQLLQMVRQLIPLVRFDGYHILADLVGVPDLFARIRPILLALVPGRRTREPNPLKPWVRVVVSCWVVAVVPFLAITLGMVAWTLPDIAGSAWDSLSLQAGALVDNVSTRDLDRIALGLVSIVAVALLPASMAFLVARIARATTFRVWTATEGHPAPRAVVLTVAVALVATVGSQWWPQPGTGPIQQASPASSDDAGGAAVPPFGNAVVALQGPVEPVVVSAPQESGPAVAVASSTTGPAVDHAAATPGPASGTDLTATAEVDTARPAWPFPFDPPPGPGAGDNHALAVNTTDGAAVVDSAISLQWLPGGTLDQANRAYALASCVDCKTVAVAFQALIAIGPSDVAVPENLAVSVNSECASCVTRAVAVQLAVTLERSPSDQARGEIALWWNRLQALEGVLEHLSPDEIHARLLEIRSAMLDILAPYGEALPLLSDVSDAPTDDALEGDEDLPPEEESSAETPQDDPQGDPIADDAASEGLTEEADDEATETDREARATAAQDDDEAAADDEPVVEEEPSEKEHEELPEKANDEESLEKRDGAPAGQAPVGDEEPGKEART